MRVAVVGASGYVGSAVARVLADLGHVVVPVRAPRVIDGGDTNVDSQVLDLVCSMFDGCQTVVNCSGNPDASERDRYVLVGANATSPALVATAAKKAGVERLVHLSSAVVQGRRPQLDDSADTEEFSAYAFSKAEGERRVLKAFEGSIIFRPPSVHGKGRRVTTMTTRIARSGFSSVAAPGDQHSPQALIENVASAVGFLATCAERPPRIVIHPWEGLTSSDLMELLGGRPPFLVPRAVARVLCRTLQIAGLLIPAFAANARRVEMLWFGQDQALSWLTVAGWRPPHGVEAWKALGAISRK